MYPLTFRLTQAITRFFSKNKNFLKTLSVAAK
jgi:hypothetical protein